VISIRGWVSKSMGSVLGMKLSAVLFMLSVALAISTATAPGAVRLGPVTTFGSLGQPNDVAVNQSNGNVLVSDVSTHAVHLFVRKSASEYEQVGEITGAETPGHEPFAFAPHEPAPVAVDSSNGALYIGDIGHHVVDKFGLTGLNEYKYECQITGFHGGCHPNLSGEEGTPEPHFGETAGVAVDSHGDVYVSDFNHNEVDEFNAADGDIAQIASGLTKEPANLAIDTLGNMYLSKFDGPVQKLHIDTVTGTIEHEQASFAPGETRAVGIDPSTNKAYIDMISQISRYESSGGALLPPVTLPGMASEGVAVNGGTGEVYVSDRGHEDIAVFGPVTVPDVKTGPALEVKTTSAQLTGEVNPLGTAEASTYFEFGETKGYGTTTPAPPGVAAGTGTEFTAAAPAVVEGLIPGTTYHYRLDATNSTGILDEGEDRTFTTPPEAPKVDEPLAFASNITTSSTIFHGTVQPGNGETRYHFIFGATEAYGHALPEIGIGSGFSPVEVEQASGAVLDSGVTYHFALVAENAGGTTVGHDEMIQTLSTAPAPTTQPTINLNPVSAITPTEATLSAAVGPEGHPTKYIFELGYAPGAYETRVFGSLAGELGTSLVVATFTNLQPGTVYHFRAVAINAAGTTASPDQTFVTALFPQSITIPPTPLLVPVPPEPSTEPPGVRCKKGFVKHANKCVRKKHHRPKPKKRHR
jgi:hypothetical protein